MEDDNASENDNSPIKSSTSTIQLEEIDVKELHNYQLAKTSEEVEL